MPCSAHGRRSPPGPEARARLRHRTGAEQGPPSVAARARRRRRAPARRPGRRRTSRAVPHPLLPEVPPAGPWDAGVGAKPGAAVSEEGGARAAASPDQQEGLGGGGEGEQRMIYGRGPSFIHVPFEIRETSAEAMRACAEETPRPPLSRTSTPTYPRRAAVRALAMRSPSVLSSRPCI